MNKKWLAMGSGIGIGVVMLVTSGLSVSASYTGYEAYKGALKQTQAVDSISGNLHLMVSNNSGKVLQVTSTFKKNNEQDASSAVVQLDNGTEKHVLNVYRQDEKTIVKNSKSDVYHVIEKQGPPWRHEGGNPEMAEEMEKVIDALVGDLRNNVTLENQANGKKKVSLHLAGNQVPGAVNAVGSLIIKKASAHHENAENTWHQGKGANALHDMKVDLPKLTDNIHVQEVNLDATINADNYLESQAVAIKINGQDASGNDHQVTVELDADLSGLNQTMPDQVDLSGKQVQTIQREDWKQHRRW
ncbi:MAG TPA: hypothetical protein VE710_13215 [Candidatus Bathyarchaeia archaeon]|nr:hypothetical protein [Candidatus Bathyarchaeia archaeon]